MDPAGGSRFHPDDEEIIDYLERKMDDITFSLPYVKEVHIYRYNPWELALDADDKEWYFFSSSSRDKTQFRRQINRSTSAGYWKVTQKDREIWNETEDKVIGFEKTLVFYQGRGRNAVRTPWVMHEFHSSNANSYQMEFFLCRLERKDHDGSVSERRASKYSLLERRERRSTKRLASDKRSAERLLSEILASQYHVSDTEHLSDTDYLISESHAEEHFVSDTEHLLSESRAAEHPISHTERLLSESRAGEHPVSHTEHLLSENFAAEHPVSHTVHLSESRAVEHHVLHTEHLLESRAAEHPVSDSEHLLSEIRALEHPVSESRVATHLASWVWLDWTFTIINLVLEVLSAAFDQLSSAHRRPYALYAMLISDIAMVFSVVEVLWNGQKAKVFWRRGKFWFYHPSGPALKPYFGTFKDNVGPFCAVCQCIVTTINYNYTNKPIQLLVWPIVYVFCQTCCKIVETRRRDSNVQRPHV